MNRMIKSFLFIVSLILVCNCTSKNDRPNIVLILADDLGYSDLGCYGSEIPTPNIDKLANDGIRFSHFYNTGRCCPTRASLLTGLYQHQTGIGLMTSEGKWDFNFGVDGYRGSMNHKCVTIAEVLKENGYHTYMTGKWHLGSSTKDQRPLQRGFEKYYGALSGAFSYFWPHGNRGLTFMDSSISPPDSNTYYTTDAFTDYAIKFIDQKNDDKPFFLYLAYNAPHWPLQAKKQDIEKFVGSYLKGWDILREERYKKQIKLGLFDESTSLSPRDPKVRAWKDVTEKQRKLSDYRMAVYAAQVYSLDYNVGKLIAYLKEIGSYNNTLILFLSDNGACAEPYKEFGGGAQSAINDPKKGGIISYGRGWANLSNTPFRLYKKFAEEGGIAAPFIIKLPEKLAKRKGVIDTQYGHIIDIMPTLLQVSSSNYPVEYKKNKIYPYEGISLLNGLNSNYTNEPRYFYFEHSNNCAVIHNNWKIISKFGKFDWALYNLKNDRTELINLASQYPNLVNELSSKWFTWAKRCKVIPKGTKTKNSYN